MSATPSNTKSTIKTTDPKPVAKPESVEPAEPSVQKDDVMPAVAIASVDLVGDVLEPQKATAKKTVLTLSFGEELVEDVRFVSYVKGISLSDYVTSKILPTIDADVQAVLAARARKRA